jgi:hypothetical protein
MSTSGHLQQFVADKRQRTHQLTATNTIESIYTAVAWKTDFQNIVGPLLTTHLSCLYQHALPEMTRTLNPGEPDIWN